MENDLLALLHLFLFLEMMLPEDPGETEHMLIRVSLTGFQVFHIAT
jgi:hypothetical protein